MREICRAFAFAVGAAISTQAVAQNYFTEQALLFGRQMPGGSARIQAMGGAQVALGGDFSSALSNPAGLGFYNRNEFSITPAITFINTNGNYNLYDGPVNNLTVTQTNSSAATNQLSLPGLAIVFGAGKNTNQGAFYGGTFAITLNRVNDFNGSMQYSGQNQSSSIVQSFLESAQGFTPNQFNPLVNPTDRNIGPGDGDNVNTPEFLGFENYLIGPIPTGVPSRDTIYFSDLAGGRPFQKETIKTQGAQNQWSLAYGANFSDKLFLGAGLGIMSVRYEYSKSYTEDFTGQSTGIYDTIQQRYSCVGCFNGMRLNESRSSSGNGINLSLGAIYKPIDFLQIGFNYTTPTSYQMRDSYSGSMTTSWNNFEYYNNPVRPIPPPPRPRGPLNQEESATIDDPVNYSLNTPSRLTVGLTVFVLKRGFVTAEIEQVNYANASTSSFSEQFNSPAKNPNRDINPIISSRFTSTTNIRVGAEYRWKNFRFRGGFNSMGNPYSNRPLNKVNYSLIDFFSVSGGIGYRTAKFFVDLAVVRSKGNGYYLPYSIDGYPAPHFNYEQVNSRIMFTVGIPF
ncbi:MAG: OmpP1/FadL family transporter [Flammeovirgaceae bacterium]